MFFIPGQLITWLTFPGVIVHEFAHQLFCKWTKTPVLDVCYFRVGNPAGYVVHENPRDLKVNLLIDIGPFIVNNILGILLTLTASLAVFTFESGDFMDYFQIWLGLSILMHSFPSTGDAKALMAAMKETEGQALLKALCYPIIGLIYIGAFGSVIWLDFIYASAVALLVPQLLVSLFV